MLQELHNIIAELLEILKILIEQRYEFQFGQIWYKLIETLFQIISVSNFLMHITRLENLSDKLLLKINLKMN